MAGKRRVVVVGARGVFGSLLVRELAEDFDVVEGTRGNLDFRGAFAVACAAGPFQQLDRALPRNAVEAGAHWLDIADDAGWFFDLLDDAALNARAIAQNVAVIPGLSSLPAISGALLRKLGALRAHLKAAAERPHSITLEINNANRKGAAAMASAAELNPPDPELFRRELGIDTTVRVKFEMPLAGPALRVLGLLPRNARIRVAKLIGKLPLRFGREGGAVEVRSGDRVLRAEGKDQRFAILPLVYALHHLDGRKGCLSPSVFDPDELLQFLG
ncbi:MAG TPA: hypothetical protein VEU30_00195 [Thermoanaerobaculia bacterium]|nr:hypothetical protein [Thermoanaerobaculia bacterium]